VVEGERHEKKFGSGGRTKKKNQKLLEREEEIQHGPLIGSGRGRTREKV